MKVFTFYYDRFDSATTSIALSENGIEHTILCHSEEDKKKFIDNGVVKGNIIATNNKKGLAYQRNYALDMLEEGEWAVFMCDDFNKIKIFSTLDDIYTKDRYTTNFTNQRMFWNNSITLKEMFSTFDYLIQKAEKYNIHLIGFSTIENPIFTPKKFSYNGILDGRFWLVKKGKLRFDENVQLIEDRCWTIMNLLEYGSILSCNWICPDFKRYTKGGFGSKTDRNEQVKGECAYLVGKYYPYIQYAKKAGNEEGTHVKIYFRGKKG